jgi:AcrR family transcriptional regulator
MVALWVKPMGRPRFHDEKTRTALLREAEKRLVEGGADAVSVRGVAEAVGTTTRAVYSVFGSREGLVSALYREAWATLRQKVEAVPTTADPSADLIAIGIDGFRAFALGHPNLFHLAFERIVLVAPSPEDVAAGWAAFELLEQRVRRCADAGVLESKSSVAFAFAFHSTCQGLASVELKGWLTNAKQPPLTIWFDTLSSLLTGYAARTRTPGKRKTSAGRSR